MRFCKTFNDTGPSSPTIAIEGYSIQHIQVHRQSNVSDRSLSLFRVRVSRIAIVPAVSEKERKRVNRSVQFHSGAIFSTPAALQCKHRAASLHLVEILVSLPVKLVHRKTIPPYILRQAPYSPHPQHAICFHSFAHFLFISVHKSKNTIIDRRFGDTFTVKGESIKTDVGDFERTCADDNRRR